MKNLFFLFALTCFVFSCQVSPADKNVVKDGLTTTVPTIDYPDELDKVFDNHGSIANWKNMKVLTFEIVKEDSNQKITTDLNNRRERIEDSKATSGFDGKNYWLMADSTYEGNVKFYTNLMFYFYAMPFVLADDGIQYTKADDLLFEKVSYPGYRISYDDGVGLSPKDEYFIHYNPETYEMAWLGYTVTFSSGEKSEKISWIRYNDWKNFDGFKLPAGLSWYKTENNLPTELRNTRNFTGIKVVKEAASEKTFKMPEGAKVVD